MDFWPHVRKLRSRELKDTRECRYAQVKSRDFIHLRFKNPFPFFSKEALSLFRAITATMPPATTATHAHHRPPTNQLSAPSNISSTFCRNMISPSVWLPCIVASSARSLWILCWTCIVQTLSICDREFQKITGHKFYTSCASSGLHGLGSGWREAELFHVFLRHKTKGNILQQLRLLLLYMPSPKFF